MRYRGPGGTAEVAGFLAPAALSGTRVQLLSEAGQSLDLASDDVLAVFFVSDFGAVRNLASSWTGARAGPRLPGLWVRVRSREHTRWDGILATGLLEVCDGVWLTPLHAEASVQRIYLPRAAVEKIEAIEVVRPARRRRQVPVQFPLFDEGTQELTKEI